MSFFRFAFNVAMATKSKDENYFEKIVKSINYKEYLCGWGAAVTNITVTYPINKIIFRQMLHGFRINEATKQIYNEGFYYLYRGMLPPLCQKTISISIMFGMYDQCHRPFLESGMNPYMAKSLAGMIAGSVEAVLMPLERIQTLLSDAQYHKRFNNTLHAFKVIGANNGIREFYRGLYPILLRNGPSNALFFIIREEVQNRAPVSTSEFNKTVYNFIGGAFIGMFLSAVFYPLNVVKVSSQCVVGGEFKSFITLVKNLYKERGYSLRNIYHGVTTNCTRSFFSWGVMNAAYENLKKIIY